MGTNNLFNNTDSSNNQQEQSEELSSEASLALLVGEGKKYADVGALAKAMVHSQSHIVKLEGEATTYRESETKNKSIQEVLDAIKSTEQVPPKVLDDNHQQTDQSQSGAINSDDITKQIETLMAARDQKTTSVTNVAAVSAALSKSLGSRANEIYKAVGTRLNVDLDELAKTSPDAVIAMCTGQQAPAKQPGETFQTQHLHTEQEVITDTALMNHEQIKKYAAEVKMPREERFKLEMANALTQGDSFLNKSN